MVSVESDPRLCMLDLTVHSLQVTVIPYLGQENNGRAQKSGGVRAVSRRTRGGALEPRDGGWGWGWG